MLDLLKGRAKLEPLVPHSIDVRLTKGTNKARAPLVLSNVLGLFLSTLHPVDIFRARGHETNNVWAY